jgi:hypothetical protein
MKTLEILQMLGAAVVGTAIGYAFGLVQQAASRRHAQLEATGKLNTAWSLMPGSMTRVAFLLVALALVQVGCPMFFTGNVQWAVSAGVVAGYGRILYQSMRARIASRA